MRATSTPMAAASLAPQSAKADVMPQGRPARMSVATFTSANAPAPKVTVKPEDQAIILFTGGFAVFTAGRWDTNSFISSYLDIPFVILFFFSTNRLLLLKGISHIISIQ